MRKSFNRKWANSRNSRGMTLIEIIIVISLIGVLMSAMAVGIMKNKGKADAGAARTFCSTLRSATLSWKTSHPGEDCPTVEQLKAERELDQTANLKDPWGGAYKLSCDADDIYCSSPGPDHKENTEDDILVPKPAGK